MAPPDSRASSATRPNFDWTPFFGREGGQLFQRLCVELLESLDMTVRESVRGGHDEGKDIIIFECPDVSWLGPPRPTCFVECKSRQQNAKSLSKSDVSGVFLAVFKHSVSRILILTNHEFNNELINYLLDVNNNDHWGLKVTWMEQAELEEAIISFSKICQKYFPALTPAQAANEAGSAARPLRRLISELRPLTPFAGAENQLRLALNNTFAEPIDITVLNAATGQERRLKLNAFEARTLVFPMPAGAEAWPQVELNGATASGQKIRQHCRIHGSPLIRVDHIYVDPFGFLDRIVATIRDNGYVLLLGGPGSGKSRLLLEVATRLEHPTQWIDLSEESYAGSLSDHLLGAIFGLPRADLVQMPETLLEASLIRRGVTKEDAATIVQIARRTAPVDPHAAAETIAAVTCKVLADRLIIIDNIHRIGPFDALILQTIASPSKPLRLILSARGNEAARADLGFWIESLIRLHPDRVIDLGMTDRRTLLRAFAAASASDRATEHFLRRFAGAPSIQEFIFTLKELKAHGFLQQDGRGTFAARHPSGPLALRTYAELYRSLIAAVETRTCADSIRTVLEAGAVYGLTFPAAFIEELAGQGGLTVLDELVQLELLIPLSVRSGGSRVLKFDHELTHEIVYNSVGLTRRDELHQRAAAYMGDARRFRPGVDSVPLAHHLACIGDYRRAAHHYHEGAVFLRREGQLVEALAAMREAHAAVIQHDDEPERHRLEFAILEDTFRLERDLGSPAEDLRRTLAALDILALLRRAYGDMDADAARLLGFRADVEEDPQLARCLAHESVERLKVRGCSRDLAEALIRAGNLAKRNGDFMLAARLTARALRLLRGEVAEDLRGAALLTFGAIFLEASRGWKVPSWWSRAVSIIAQRAPPDVAVLAHALVDEAYAFGLFRPTDVQTPARLERAYHFAMQRRLAQTQCRAAINWANWRYFHLKESERAHSLLDEADEIAAQRNLRYHAALVAFSRLNFDGPGGSKSAQESIGRVRKFLASPDHVKGRHSGDWRARNMMALLLALGDRETWGIAKASNPRPWASFYRIGIGARLAELEQTNPYFRGTGYITYY